MTEAINFLNSFSEVSEEDFMTALENAATYESLDSNPPLDSVFRFNDGSRLRVFHSITTEQSEGYFNTPSSTQRFSWTVLD